MLVQLSDPIGLVPWVTFLFLAASLIFGIMNTLLGIAKACHTWWCATVEGKPSALPLRASVAVAAVNVEDGNQLGPVLEAITGLTAALVKAPAWFALFLAGFALFWVSEPTNNTALQPDSFQETQSTEVARV